MRRTSPFILPICLTLTCWLALVAEDSPPKPPSKEKKVWTNEEVEKLPGDSVNVVGKPRKPTDSKGVDAKQSTSQPALPKGPDKEVCESDTWAAGISFMLRAQGVPHDEKFWGLKVLGGPCAYVPTVATMAKSIEGDYVLDDGSKIRINANASSNLPSSAEMVKSTQENRPFLIGYNQQCWLAVLVEYDDVVYYDNGGEIHDYVIKKITFVDPVRGNKLIFEPTPEQLAKITGVITTSVEKRK